MPKAYAAFAPVFDRLSDALQKVLLGLLPQFEALAQRPDPPEAAEQGEFEGLGGLTLRGDIGHLVQSELVLRTEAPMEFLRRLAESETLFHEKQYADPGARPIYRAMISVGPGGLGHGRIIALAALFFLARLAVARKAEFHWCFMPRDGGAVWFEGLDANALHRLLKAASFREMGGEDLAEARDVWTHLSGDQARPIDWVIGARAHGRGADTAVKLAANSLSFQLAAPAPRQPREARLTLRERHHDRPAIAVLFPEDDVCVSALNDPFRPMVPAVASALPLQPPGRPGWAPQYFATASHGAKIIRLADGMLIVTFERETQVVESWLLPLAPDLMVVGVRVHSAAVSIAVYSGQGRLSYAMIYTVRNKAPQLAHARYKDVPAAQLFRQHSRHAIPPMQVSDGIRFYSASGQTYHLGFNLGNSEVRFTPLYHGDRILGSDGTYHLLQKEEAGETVLEARKHGDPLIDRFLTPALSGKEVVLGLTYSRSEHSAAYSITPNRWIIPRSIQAAGRSDSRSVPPVQDRHLTLQRHEHLLAARWQPDGLIARIWSDARHGGDGTIRAMRQREDQVTHKHSTMKLGDTDGEIVKVEPGNSGYWAVAVDGDGEPSELLHYRAGKESNASICVRFILEDLVRSAKVIHWEVLNG